MDVMKLLINTAFLVILNALLFAFVAETSDSGSDRRLRNLARKQRTQTNPLQEKSDRANHRYEAAHKQNKVTTTSSGRWLHRRHDMTSLDWNVASSKVTTQDGAFGAHEMTSEFPAAPVDTRSDSRSKRIRAMYDIMPQSDQESKLLNEKTDSPNKKDQEVYTMGSSLTTGTSENEKILHFTANPQTIVLAETEVFALTCSVNLPALSRSSKGSVQPMSLELDKHDGQTHRRLAVLSAIHGAIPIRDEITSGARITGSVSKDDSAPWTMSITWSEPTLSSLEGTYICKLSGLGPHKVVSDYAYTKLDVTVRDSPRVKLEARLATTEDKLDEVVKDGARRDGTLKLMRLLLVNVTGLLVDTSNHSRLMRQKINNQAHAYVDLRKHMELALESDRRLEEHINFTERSIATTLDLQAKAMSQMYEQVRRFAHGLHAMDMRDKSLEQLIYNVKEGHNKKLDIQTQDVVSMKTMLEAFEDRQSQTDKLLADLGKQVSHLNAMLNKTSEKLHSLQTVLGLTEGAIRLNNNGAFGSEGRLEVFHNGQWGTVCDDSFDINAAQVVCRQLGYEINKAMFYGKAHYGQGAGIPVLLDDVTCYGQETKLVQCSHNVWGYTTCKHDEDVGVKC